MKRYYKLSAVHILTAIVCFVILSLNTSACQAANWEWVISTDEVTIEIDTTSVQKVNYTLAGPNIVCWFKYTNLDKSYSLHHEAFRVKNQNPESTIFETYTYNSDGRNTDYAGHPEPYNFEYKSIIPGSLGEYLFYKAAVYAKMINEQ